MQGFRDCWSSCSNDFTNFLFFFYNGPYAGFIILKWWATAAADLDLWYLSSHLTFSCNVMTFLCFLGPLPASLSDTSYGSRGVIQGLWYCTNHDGKYTRTLRSLFTVTRNFLERETAHMLISWSASHSNGGHSLITIATGGGYEIIYVSAVCTIVNFMPLWLNTVSSHLFKFPSTAYGTLYGLCLWA